jgi:hypothetical protein
LIENRFSISDPCVCEIKADPRKEFIMDVKYVNLDYCGIVMLLRQLIQNGTVTMREAKKIAARIAAQCGADIIISL